MSSKNPQALIRLAISGFVTQGSSNTPTLREAILSVACCHCKVLLIKFTTSLGALNKSTLSCVTSTSVGYQICPTCLLYKSKIEGYVRCTVSYVPSSSPKNKG